MSRFVLPYPSVFDTNGDPYSGAKLYFYASGTSTAAATYSNSALTAANSNPVVADASGRFSDIFLSDVNYKVVLKTAADVTVWTADPVSSLGSGSGGDTSLLLGDSFTGDGATVNFTLSASVTSGSRSVMVAVDGITQLPATYSVSGTTLTFSTAPPLNSVIDVRAFSTAEFDEGLSIVSADTTLNVPSGYATVAAALEYLRDKWISPAATVTISVAAGTHTSSSPIVFDHPCGDRIKIQGATPLTPSISGQVSTSGSAGAWSVVLTLSSVTDISVGYWLLTYSTTGTGDHYAHRGVWEITAVDSGNSRVTVKNTNRNSAFPTNTITASSSAVLKSVLSFTGCDGLVVPSATLGELNDIMICGNSDSYWLSGNITGTERGTHGIYAGALTIALNGKSDNVNSLGVSGGHVSCNSFVGVSGFDQQGVCVELGGTVWGDYLSACNNKRRGFYASTAAGIRAKRLSACGNYLDGVITDISGAVYCSNISVASGNGGSGFVSTQCGVIIADTGVASGNGTSGFRAVSGATVQATSAIALNNTGDGFYGEYGASIYCNSSSSTGNGSDGLELAFNSVARANSMTLTGNTGYGVKLTEQSYATITSSTMSPNTAGDYSLRAGSLMLDNVTYYAADTQVGALTATSIDSGSGNIVTTGDVRASTLRLTEGANNVIADCTGAGALALSFTGTSRFVMTTGGVFYPAATGTQDLGRTSERWNNLYATKYAFGASTQHISSGTGTPEGAVTAGVGSLFLRTDGGASTTLYIKESGSGNTGWVAK